MATWLLRRLIQAVFVLLAMTVIVFIGVNVIGNPVDILLSPEANQADPIVTVVGLEFGSTVAFAVVTESVFAWPGTGKLIIDSINHLDRPVIVAYLVIIVLLFTVINLGVDIVYSVLDPRVRLEGRE